MKGKKRWLVFAAVFLAAGAELPAAASMDMGRTVRGNGDVVAVEREAQGFATVTLHRMANVRIHPGEGYRVVLTTDSNLQDRIFAGTRGEGLTIAFDSPDGRPENVLPTYLSVDIFLPELRGVVLSNSGDVSVGSLDADSLRVTISGSGSVSVAEGSAESLIVTISGSGSVSAESLQAGAASVVMQGRGNARVWAKDSLSVTMHGAGNVAFRGDPAEIRVANSAGGGRITRF